ncbi:unnamed protein product [Lactuca virosa]|uniref:Uncharacterized protein n=1 Tax=Lactuca virosa TaxID=75947 RepID=A0AAU9PCZ8_9ASTR|nr:unnamed protein product [Lactuca virosa]
MSVLLSKIQDLENSMATQLSSEKSKSKHVVMEDEEMKTQLESARGLIEKLVFENEKLIEKVNNLNGEVTTTDDPMVTNSEADDETSATETTDDRIIESMKKI